MKLSINQKIILDAVVFTLVNLTFTTSRSSIYDSLLFVGSDFAYRYASEKDLLNINSFKIPSEIPYHNIMSHSIFYSLFKFIYLKYLTTKSTTLKPVQVLFDIVESTFALSLTNVFDTEYPNLNAPWYKQIYQDGKLVSLLTKRATLDMPIIATSGVSALMLSDYSETIKQGLSSDTFKSILFTLPFL